MPPRAVFRSSSSPLATMALEEEYEKDLSNNTASTEDDIDASGMDQPVGGSARYVRDGLDASRHGGPRRMSQPEMSTPGPRRGLSRGIWSSMRSFRTNRPSPVVDKPNKMPGSGRVGVDKSPQRQLPMRQATFNTQEPSDKTMLSEKLDEMEECVELQEKVEALERKLETKDAVLRSLMVGAADGDDPLKLKVLEQAKRIEELEEEQAQGDKGARYFEQIQEQQETITRMEGDHEYKMSMQLRKEKQLQEMLAKIQKENQQLKEQHEKELQQMRAKLTQTTQEAEGYRTQAEDLRTMVTEMEQMKQDEIHLLQIAMSSIEDVMAEQERQQRIVSAEA